jgi:hypothetical protein
MRSSSRLSLLRLCRGCVEGATSLSHAEHGEYQGCDSDDLPLRAWRRVDLPERSWCVAWWDSPDVVGTIARMLDVGPGFAVLTGVRVEPADLAGARRQALEIVGSVGTPLVQDERGERACVVRDEGHVLFQDGEHRPRRTVRSSKSREGLPFHNDRAPGWFGQDIDLMALLTVSDAAEGGETVLVNAKTAYQVLLDKEPAAAATLREEFVFDCSSHEAAARGSTSPGPVFAVDGERFAARCNRMRIEVAADATGRSLTAEQVDALDALDEVLGLEELQIRFTMRAGECLLLDDRMILHSRTAFRDAGGDAPGRCLIRVWATRHPTGTPDR